MTRTSHSVASRRRKKRILESSSGYVMGRSNLYRHAAETVMRAERYAYRDRRRRKRDFRRLWITRLSAALIPHGISYSRFIAGLSRSGFPINRKSLSELAILDAEAFKAVVDGAKRALQA